MTASFDHHHDPEAARATRLISHLDGALDEQMLAAMQGAWSMLEHASTNAPSHARAVRSRLFWESLAPGGVAAAPGTVSGLQPSGDEREPELGDRFLAGGSLADAA